MGRLSYVSVVAAVLLFAGCDEDAGRVKVLDFGLAAGFEPGSFDEERGRGSSTLGGLGGTPRYASPEQLLGRPVTPRSDQFSFCVAMFEALSGRLPFAGETRHARRTAMLAGHMAPIPVGVPKPVSSALARGLSPDPGLRFESMEALLGAFERREARAVGAGALAVAVLGLGVWLVRPAEPVPCADGTARMQQAWPRPRAAGWTDRPELVRAATELDARVDAWLAVRADLCARRAEQPREFERGAACLERMASRIHSTGERVLGLGDAALPSNLLGGVADPEQCLEVDTDTEVDQLLRDEFDGLLAEAMAADADGLLEPDERAEILGRAGALRVRASELGDARVQGQLALLMGAVSMAGTDYAGAERQLQEGFFVADLAGDPRTQLQLAGNLVKLFSEYLGEPERAKYWAQKGAEVAAQLGTDDARGQASYMRAAALLSADEPEASLAHFDEAEPLLEDQIDRRMLLNQRATAYGRLQQTDEARADLNEAVRLIEETLGPNHADLVVPLNTLATLHIIDERFDEAMATLERVLSLIPESDRLRRALVQGNLAILLQRTGHAERSLAMFQSVARAFEDLFGLEHEHTVRTRLAVVEALTALGRKEDALREIGRLLDQGVPDSFLSRALFARASVVDDPRPDLERILTLPGEPESTLKAAREGLAGLEAEGR
ncbi:MAG: tetratricopeptide repeat protein [Nannocystaceae bacterium]